MTTPLVIYHKDCFDGHTAAWVFRHFRGDAEWHPARYGDTPPKTDGREVYVLDFSYPRAAMKALILGSRSTVVLDHHKTAETALDGLLDELQHIDQRQPGDEIVFDMERSGAGITWDYLSDEAAEGVGCSDCGGRGDHQAGCPWGERPWLVSYVEDRDLWRQSLVDGEYVSAWVAAQPMTFAAWDDLIACGQDAAINSGRAVQAYIHQYGTKALKEARYEMLAGYSVPTVNMPYMNCSEHVGRLLREEGVPTFAAGYFRRDDGRWQFSLRGAPGFDVSEVAKQFGGGGHAGAAGFDVERLPWEP